MRMRSFMFIFFIMSFLPLGQALSRPLAQVDTTYQTGVQTIFNTNFNSLTDVAYNVPYTTLMLTPSINASLAIMGTKYNMISTAFGWKMSIASVTSTSLSIHIAITNIASSIFYMKISFLASSNTDLDINYVSYSFNSATDPVADFNTAAVFGSCCCSISCRQYTTTVSYDNKLNPKVIALLSGFEISSFGTGAQTKFGIALDTSGAGLSSFTIKVTVYGEANLAFVSFFYVSYNDLVLNVINQKTTITGTESLGCTYTTLGCNVVGSISNTTFKTSDTSVLSYSSNMFFIGLSRIMLKYTGTTAVTGQFEVTNLAQNSDSSVQVTFAFTGNTINEFNTAISYFTMQTFNCNPTGIDMYAVSGSNFCESHCNNDIQQYMDANNVCSACAAQCYRCVGISTFCMACFNTQNRVLAGNTCVCDIAAGFYDDLSSLACPQCQYSCKTCNGGTSSQCSSCLSTNFRTYVINACPCNTGYYDAGASVCVSCHYTCRTATCTNSGATQCATCNSAKFRTYLANSSCGCMTGYFDNSTSNELCDNCHYSCLTCSVTNIRCITCDLANHFRTLSSTNCKCTTGYYDNSVAICAPCHSTCVTCTGPLASNCLTCSSALNRQIVITTCQCKNYYYDLINICYACHHSCLTCTSNPSTNCNTCTASARRTFKASTSECICNAGTVDTGVQYCQSCNPSCLTCSVSTTSCDSCHSNPGRYFLGNVCLCSSTYADVTLNGVCTPCHYSCLTCRDGTTSGCITCSNSRLLTSNQCLCPIGFYDTGSSVVCLACHANCLTCISGVSTGCRTCQSLYYRTLSPSPTGSCICQIGYYEVGVLICSPCSQYCLTCSIISTNCTSCDSVTNKRQSATNNVCACMNGFYESGATICPICQTPCLTCSLLPNNCTSCSSDRTISSNVCYCNFGTFQLAGVCTACAVSCLSCSGASTTCLSCPTNSNRAFLINACPCNSGFYDNGVAICPRCSYTCLTCTLLNSCTACPVNSIRTYQSNNTCPCNAAFYDNGNVICAACSPYCLTCIAFSQCQTCNSALFRSLITLSSTCPCIDGYYDNGVDLDCKLCQHSCATCFGGTDSACISCATLRTLTSPNNCPCNAGLYESGTSCSPCSIVCKTCSITPTNCTSCPINSYLSSFNCFCNTGYYMNGLICNQCNVQCQTCTVTPNNCQSCNPIHGSLLSGSTCICLTTQFKHPTTLVCTNCHSYCLTCSAATNTTCLSCHPSSFRTVNISNACACNSGYYDAGTLICVICQSPCSNCVGGSVLNCSTCITGFTLIGSSCMPNVVCSNYYFQGKCLSSCPNTTYDSGSLMCSSCINNCLTCTSATVCTTCKNGYYFNSNACQLICPTATYSNTVNSSCTGCPSECLTCALRNNIIICLSCSIGYNLNGSQCINTCPTLLLTHLIVNSACVSCLNQCQTCSSLSFNGCLSCKTNYNLHLGMCLSVCPVGFYAYNLLCSPCESNCLSCAYSACVTCITGYYVSTNAKCSKLNYYIDESLKEVACHANCLTCKSVSFSSCISCSEYRGDTSEMAISGYCDCWKDTIDVGNGKCDKQSFKAVQQANEVLVTFTTSLNYISSISGVISMNYFAPVMLISYQQLYSNFYYLNSSAVLQSDQVLQKYSQSNFNRLIESFSNNQKSSNSFSRRLQSVDFYQKEESLFMRGFGWQYLIDWALYTFLMIVIVWFIILLLILVLRKMKKEYSQSSNAYKYTKTTLMVFRENLVVILHILTINDVVFYGAASFKIFFSWKYEINMMKLVLSGMMMAYYVGYLLRLFVACYRFKGEEEQQNKFIVLYSSVYSVKKQSFLSRVYLPMMMLKSMCISVALVFLAYNPQAQIITCLMTFLAFTIYSYCYCPYYFYLKFFIHIFQVIFLLQLLLLLISVLQPEMSKIGPAYGLIALNYIQVVIFLVMTLTILFTKLFDLRCWEIKEKRIIPFKKQKLQEQNCVPVFNQKRQIMQETKAHINLLNESSLINIQNFDKRFQFNLPDEYIVQDFLQKKIEQKNKAQNQNVRRRRRDKVIEEEDIEVIKLEPLEELSHAQKRKPNRSNNANNKNNE